MQRERYTVRGEKREREKLREEFLQDSVKKITNLALQKKVTKEGNTKRFPSVSITPTSMIYRDNAYLKRFYVSCA